jgi:hypothetical protein
MEFRDESAVGEHAPSAKNEDKMCRPEVTRKSRLPASRACPPRLFDFHNSTPFDVCLTTVSYCLGQGTPQATGGDGSPDAGVKSDRENRPAENQRDGARRRCTRHRSLRKPGVPSAAPLPSSCDPRQAALRPTLSGWFALVTKHEYLLHGMHNSGQPRCKGGNAGWLTDLGHGSADTLDVTA